MSSKKTGLGVLANKASVEEANRNRMALLATPVSESQPDAAPECSVVTTPPSISKSPKTAPKSKSFQKCIYLDEEICRALQQFRLEKMPVNSREAAVIRLMAVEFLQKRGYLKNYSVD
jgi:hypothetical protein